MTQGQGNAFNFNDARRTGPGQQPGGVTINLGKRDNSLPAFNGLMQSFQNHSNSIVYHGRAAQLVQGGPQRAFGSQSGAPAHTLAAQSPHHLGGKQYAGSGAAATLQNGGASYPGQPLPQRHHKKRTLTVK